MGNEADGIYKPKLLEEAVWMVKVWREMSEDERARFEAGHPGISEKLRKVAEALETWKVEVAAFEEWKELVQSLAKR